MNTPSRPLKFFSCLLFFCLIHFLVCAQQAYDTGYIVNHSLDTVRGFIKVAMESELSFSVKFKKTINEDYREYKPTDLLGFKADRDIYQTMQFKDNAGDSIKTDTAFVKLLATGAYKLYSYVRPDRRFYLLQKGNDIYFLYDRLALNMGETVQDANYFNYLKFISSGCGKLNGMYERVEFNDEDMADFVVKTNKCISGENSVSLYQKPKSTRKLIVFVGGLPNNQFTANLSYRFTLPKIDRKTSINIGLNYSYTSLTTTEEIEIFRFHVYKKDQIISLPVTLQYNLLSGAVQPYFYAGLSPAFFSERAEHKIFNLPDDPYITTDNHFAVGFVFGLGIDIRILSKLYLRADWRYELFLQYPAIGLSYHF